MTSFQKSELNQTNSLIQAIPVYKKVIKGDFLFVKSVGSAAIVFCYRPDKLSHLFFSIFFFFFVTKSLMSKWDCIWLKLSLVIKNVAPRSFPFFHHKYIFFSKTSSPTLNLITYSATFQEWHVTWEPFTISTWNPWNL